ncbi:hypothetical protein NLJ89_g8253 [Agrocybe chaxingu]|uniref:Uncharacterized protein n=1 Tax=Agrocybe chaxingu TaxID=84603 RepID=A0A9W8JSZ7_9AGAR|nr:hypothetical protein NLJ89_g8253 [Agrocybe chaxingu]
MQHYDAASALPFTEHVPEAAMLPPDDPFGNSLKLMLEANYHPSSIKQPARVKPVDATSSPLTFYDRHISSNLILKRVILLPSIPKSLSGICEQALQTFTQNGRTFSPYESALFQVANGILHDAFQVADYYQTEFGQICQRFASKLLVTPGLQGWHSVFAFQLNKDRRPGEYLTDAWLKVLHDPARDVCLFSQELQKQLDQPVEDRLSDLAMKYPRLADWYMFAMSSTTDRLFRSMFRNPSSSQELPFVWESSQTKLSQQADHTHRPADADEAVLKAVLPKRPASKPEKQLAQPRPKKPSRLPRTRVRLGRPTTHSYRLVSRLFLQHGWSQATFDDCSFIIFNCGRWERIGIRHRATQTLYLSNLIDPAHAQDPHYRKMHVGLHIAIVQDAFARQQIFNEVGADPALEPGEGRKQSREPSPPDDEEPQPKRRRSTCFPSTASEIARESRSSCHPAFYPSYVDEKFKTTYDLSECVSLVLGAPLGQGAVGIVHSASLEVGLESGEVLQRDVIVKLAFSEGQAERLRQEFDIYSVLVKKKATKGILTVHGLFEDTESGALALVMENGGQTLRQREKERLNATQAEQVTTTPEER